MRKLENPSLLVSTFFGLTSEEIPEFRKNLFKQIHEIVFHGKGGYDWLTIYNMPIWLRKFTFNEINEFYKKQSEEMEKAQNKNTNKKTIIPASGKITPPKFKTPSKSSYK
jgi:hypothetical protein